MSILVNGEPIRYDLIPVRYMEDGLRRYFEQRAPSDTIGGFLYALLTGDLMEYFRRADSNNMRCCKEWVVWLSNYAPNGSFGSVAAVKSWLGEE